MSPSRDDALRLVLGSPGRRDVRAVGRATALAAATAIVFLGLYRVSMGLVELGLLRRVVTLPASAVKEASWIPVSWHFVWFGVLVLLSSGTVALGVRHAERGGGLLGTVAYVVAVPLGTDLYHRVQLEFPHLAAAELPADGIAFFPFGFGMVGPWHPHWLDGLVAVVLVAVVFGAGRRLASRTDRKRANWFVVTTSFTGAFLAGYMVPDPCVLIVNVYPTARYVPNIRYGFFYGVPLAAVGWALLQAIRWSTRRRGNSMVTE